MKRLLYIFLSLTLLSVAGIAQTPTPTPLDDTDLHQWSDTTVSKQLHNKVDAFVQTTFRFTKNITRFNEGRIGGGFVFRPHKSFSIGPNYMFIRARNSSGRFATENRLTLGLTYRFPFKKVGLSHRSQFEYRIRSSGNSWRYRPSVTIEKQLPEKWIKGIKVYVTEDPFYDSAAGRFSRNRLTFGVNKALFANHSVDLYYLRQDDRNSHPAVTYVLGTGWKLKF